MAKLIMYGVMMAHQIFIPQNHPDWKNEVMVFGAPRDNKIGEIGCLTTCLTIWKQITTGIKYTPIDINQIILSVDGYDTYGRIKWDVVGQVLGFNRRVSKDYNEDCVIAEIPSPIYDRHFVYVIQQYKYQGQNIYKCYDVSNDTYPEIFENNIRSFREIIPIGKKK